MQVIEVTPRVRFKIPDPVTPFREAEALYRLCDANGLDPTWVWKGAGLFIQSKGRDGFEFWATVLELVGIDWTDDESIPAEAWSIHFHRIRKLQERIERHNERVRQLNGDEPEPQVKEKPFEAPTPKPKQETTQKDGWDFLESDGSGRILGFSVSSVLRWFGKSGARPQDVIVLFEWCGVPCSTNTIRTQVAAGMNGKRGKPAAIPEKIAELLKTKLAECGHYADSVKD